MSFQLHGMPFDTLWGLTKLAPAGLGDRGVAVTCSKVPCIILLAY